MSLEYEYFVVPKYLSEWDKVWGCVGTQLEWVTMSVGVGVGVGVERGVWVQYLPKVSTP